MMNHTYLPYHHRSERTLLGWVVLFSLLFFFGWWLASLYSSQNQPLFPRAAEVGGEGEKSAAGSFQALLKKTPPKPQPPPKPTLNVPILLYHYVEPMTTDENDTLRKSLTVTPYSFDSQLAELKSSGYQAVGLSDLLTALKGEGSAGAHFPDKAVVLTFDDGYSGFYYYAFPLLKKHGFKAINYVIVNRLGTYGYFNQKQGMEMISSNLVEIGSHSLTHADLRFLAEANLVTDLTRSKELLSKWFVLPVLHFAYPGGGFDEKVIAKVTEAGYATAVSTIPGVWQNLDMRYQLRRIKIGNWSGQFLVKYLEERAAISP